MEKEVRHRKTEVAEDSSTRSVEAIISDAKEKGSPDLSEISQKEREVILHWYKNSELTERDRVDFMEEFMRYGLIDDAAALEYIRAMNERQKGQLAEYIGRVIRPGAYMQSFYECFPEANFDAKRQLIAALSADPKSAVMIAPFRDLQKIQTKEVKGWYGKVTRKSLLESEFNSLEEAQKLLDALLRYYEGHPDIQGYADGPVRESRISRWRFNRFYSGPGMNLENIIYHYLDTNALVLYPYLEKLQELGFLSKEQITPLFEGKIHYTSDQTREEEAEVKELTKKLKGSDEKDFYLFSAAEAVPQKYAFAINEIHDRGAVRSVDSILRNFKEQRKRFGFNHTKFLIELMNRGAPIFSRVEYLGLSKEDVRVLLVRAYHEEGVFFNLHGYGDMKALLEWNRRHKDSEGPDLEKTIADLFIDSLGDGENANTAIHLRDIVPWFEESNRRKIIKAINQRAPHFWLLGLRYAIENNVMPLDELIARSSQGNSHWLLMHFNTLLHDVSILKKKVKKLR